jgi:hypothetical protein
VADGSTCLFTDLCQSRKAWYPVFRTSLRFGKVGQMKKFECKDFSEFGELFFLSTLVLSSLLVILLIFATPNIFQDDHPEESAALSEIKIPTKFMYK